MSPISRTRLAAGCMFAAVLVASGAVGADARSQLSSNSRLPPVPGAAGKATLAGVDTNGNKIRDDLEPFMLRHFGKKPRILRSVSNVVISLQAAINARTDQESSRAQSMMIRSSECMAAIGEEVLSNQDRIQELFTMLVDTPQRTAAAEAHQTRIGQQQFAVRSDPAWDAHCELRADLVGNVAQANPRRE